MWDALHQFANYPILLLKEINCDDALSILFVTSFITIYESCNRWVLLFLGVLHIQSTVMLNLKQQKLRQKSLRLHHRLHRIFQNPFPPLFCANQFCPLLPSIFQICILRIHMSDTVCSSRANSWNNPELKQFTGKGHNSILACLPISQI